MKKSPVIHKLAKTIFSGLFFCLCLPALNTYANDDFHKLVQALREQLVKDITLDLDTDNTQTDLLWLDLRSFYSQRRFQPIWFDGNGLNQKGKLWMETIQNAEQEGLNPDDYNLCFFQRHCNDELAEQQVWVELLLTKALLTYIEHMHGGRFFQQSKNFPWYIEKKPVDALALFTSVVDAGDFKHALKDLQPQHREYQRLRKALGRYLQLQSNGGWPEIPEGPVLQVWDSHKQIPLIRQRLQREGDLVIGSEDSQLFDKSLKLAVQRFQVRYGIDVDGIIGPETREAMNIPIADRVRQIKLNMERWRWLPRDLGARYILVNTAGYELAVYEADKPLAIFRIIAGTPDRPTPVVTGPLESIMLNPYWYIPRIIAVNDVLPRQMKNSNFFKAMGIRVFKNNQSQYQEVELSTIDWSHIDRQNFPYALRQDPGPRNSLGQIKFKFANDFALYLHDTPKQRLFDRETRAFSSGCIRVENAIDLAAYLLQNQTGWSKQDIQQTIDSGKTVNIALEETIPLYLVYWTTWVSSDDTVYFRKDVYGWDRDQSQCS